MTAPPSGAAPFDAAPFGPGARFHHVGVAVASIARLAPHAEVIDNATERVRMAFVELGGVRLELLEPLGADSPIQRNRERGTKLLHLCFEVDDLDAAIEQGRRHGYRRMSPIERVPEFGDRRLVWLMHRDLGLVELIEVPPRRVESSDAPAEGEGARAGR